jgi:two-component system cell cycle sensor histidine kinase/response regulator CckA
MIHMVKPTRLSSAEQAGLAADAEQAARAADAKPSSRDAIIHITRAGIVSSWNPPAVLLYGYLEGEIVGRAADVICPPDVRASEAEVLRRIIAGGATERYEADRVCKDGTAVKVSLTAAPMVSKAGAITGVTTVSWKVGGRQGVHDQVEAGVESERRNSREAQERFDVKVDTERRDSRDAQERFEAKVDAERRHSRDALERFDARVNTERRHSRDAQERFDAKVNTERRHSRDAQDQVEEEIESVRRDAWVIQDRFDARRDAERRLATEQNELLQAKLQQAQRLENLGQLAGGIAHDFNNLLAVILNYATFVAEELDAASESDWAQRRDTARGDVGQIKLAAERAAGLTHQLLAFARREVVRPQVLDLNQVVGGVAEMLRRTLGEHVELATLPAGALWPVLADPGQLEQVLVNLAVNARDAMPGGGTLTIDTANVTVDDDSVAGGSKARPGRHVRLRVSDSGTGMPPDVVAHAFEPFFTTKPEGAGTGLGLATVYGIITQAEGQVQIYSEPGAGTTFSIMLPVTAEAAIAVVERVPYQRSPKGETILVVEDEAALRGVTKRIFVRNGYHVITAASGPEAIEIVRNYEGEIHLLVTDVVMPHMLGKEVAEKILAIKPDIEVLFISGYARRVLTSQGMLDPGVALVEKPFSEADLMDKSARVLNGHFQGFKTIKGTEA